MIGGGGERSLSTSIPTSWHCACSDTAAILAGPLGEIMLQLQSAFGIVALLAIAWALGENRRAVSLRQADDRAGGDAAHRRDPDQAAVRRARLRRHQRRRRRDCRGLARRHLLRVRLCRRRRAAVRSQGARRRFHPGVPGAADRAGHERADHAAVLLARAAADRARHGVAAGAHARRRRRGRTCPPPPTSFSAWSRRRCSCGLIWRR